MNEEWTKNERKMNEEWTKNERSKENSRRMFLQKLQKKEEIACQVVVHCI